MVDVAGARVVAILSRAPSAPGKTRLFAALGRAPDPRLGEALLLDTLDGVAAPGVVRLVSVTPPSARREVAALVPPGVEVIAQGGGDLGDRMRGLFASLFNRGASAVALVGSDLPTITPVIIGRAFDAVARRRDALALGPAVDGGYYLIAASRVPDVFDDILWGGDSVLSRTVATAADAGLHVTLLEALADVDTPADLERAAGQFPASRTAAWVREGGQ